MDNLCFIDEVTIEAPAGSDTVITCTKYHYHHYVYDGFDDRGWGCGYRTLQTICSWINIRLALPVPVPSLPEIQEILVAMGDKDKRFMNSRDWIGSVEVGLVIDKLFDVPCKIIHVSQGRQLSNYVKDIKEHFLVHKSPIMMGGETDTSSKGIVGLATSTSDTYLLVLDPHMTSPQNRKLELSDIIANGYLSWVNIRDFHQESFYNLCLPQAKHLN